MTKDQLKVGFLNIRSLLPSIQEIRALIVEHCFDIFLIAETWLHAGISDDLIKLEGFRLYRRDRPTRGGGLCIYASNKLNTTIIQTSEVIEQLWLEIKTDREKNAVGVIYKPPTFNTELFLNELEDTLILLTPSVKNILLTGDFNINLLNIPNPVVDNFYSVLETFNLKQIIEVPTRVTEISESLLDLIIVSMEEDIVEIGVLENDSSDHHLIHCTLKVCDVKSGPRIFSYRNFKNFDYEKFEFDLFEIPWYIIFDLNSVDEKVDYLINNLTYLFEVHAPMITSRFTRPYAPWITDNIKIMISIRDKALKRFKNTNNIYHKNFYKDIRNYTTQAIRREKKAYFEHKIKNGTPKQNWKLLRNNNCMPIKKNKEIPVHLSDLNVINDFFVNGVPQTSASDEVTNFYNNNKINDNNFKFKTVSDNCVYEILTNITTTATGCDGINITMLKLCCPHIIPYLTHIVNHCLIENTFPAMWKRAVVSVLPKKANPEILKDLRCISILPTLSKIVEKIMELQLREHLEQNSLIPIIQSGFRPGHSCTTALLHIVDEVITATDKGLCTILVSLDFSRAFDTINYDILLAILHYIGLSENAIQLFSNYLRNRGQYVLLNNNKSNFMNLKTGVPQGSILGPLLFTIYTSNLVNLKYSKIHLYADDTQLYQSFSASDIHTASLQINEDLDNFLKVAKDHCLVINPSKSNFIIFGPKMQRNSIVDNINIQIEGNILEKKDKVKSLGVIIDADLRFKENTNKLLQKGYSSLKLIYGNRHFLPRKTKILLCETLVLSTLNYADCLYGPCLDSVYVKKVQKLQNSCLRLIYGIRRNQRISHKLKETNWLNMKNRRLHHSACLFHNIVIDKSPVYLYQKIKFRTDVHTLNVRFKGLLTPPVHRTEIFTRCFSYQVYKIYNNIHDTLKNYSKCHFKKIYKLHLFKTQCLQ